MTSNRLSTIPRSKCLLTKKEDIKQIYSFKNFPIYMGCVDDADQSNDLFYDMVWGYSESSGSLQLMDLLNPELLYKEHHNSGKFGKTWEQHHKKFFNFIKKYNYYNVLEIGGASGSLVNLFLEEDKNFQWTIIEPSEQTLNKDDRVKFIKGFFEEHCFDKKFDTIVHSHLMEHVYNPLDFLEKIKNTLDDDGNHFMTFPNMKSWIELGATSTLTFEHTYYVDENVIDYLLKVSGFEIIEKLVEPHSIFIYCKKSKQINIELPDFKYIKKLYDSYIEELTTDVMLVKELIGNNSFYLFGGHIWSQVLLNLGLPEKQIINILDNDPDKQNKRLYGTNLLVKSPQSLCNIKNPIILLRAGTYTAEIKDSILTINPTAIFI